MTLSRQFFETFPPEVARAILEADPSGSTRRKSPWSYTETVRHLRSIRSTETDGRMSGKRSRSGSAGS